MSKKILLARPHPMIVSDMKPFLEENDFSISKIDNFEQIGEVINDSAGAVISLAVNSSIKESALEVYQKIRAEHPFLPVIFVSMLPFSKAIIALNGISDATGKNKTMIAIELKNSRSSILGKPNTFLYISKDDLSDKNQRMIASQIIKNHLK